MKVVQKISTKLKILGKNQTTNTNSNANCANFNTNTKLSYYKLSIYQPTTRLAVVLSTTVTTITLLSFTATGTHSGPMDISYAERQRPLTAEEKERQNKLGLCRYYGQPGHMAKDHNDASTLQAKRYAVGIHAMAIASLSSENMSLENTLSSSIVALRDLLD